MAMLREFVTSRPPVSRQLLREHPGLLTDRTDELLERFLEYLRSRQASDALIEAYERGRSLLAAAREQGVDAAFDSMFTSEEWTAAFAQDAADLCTRPEPAELSSMLHERPWMLTTEFEELLMSLVDELREAGEEENAVVMDARRYLVHRCRNGGIVQGLAQAHLVQTIRHSPELRAQFAMSDEALMGLMDSIAGFCAGGLSLTARRSLIGSHPDLLSPSALDIMGTLADYDGLPEDVRDGITTAWYLVNRAMRDGIDAALRAAALIGAYSTTVSDEAAVGRFDEYLNIAGADATSALTPQDVEPFAVDSRTVARRRRLLEVVRASRPRRARQAVEQFLRAYTPIESNTSWPRSRSCCPMRPSGRCRRIGTPSRAKAIRRRSFSWTTGSRPCAVPSRTALRAHSRSPPSGTWTSPLRSVNRTMNGLPWL